VIVLRILVFGEHLRRPGVIDGKLRELPMPQAIEPAVAGPQEGAVPLAHQQRDDRAADHLLAETRQVEQAMSLRKVINTHPLISKYFHVVTVAEMIPAEYRKSGIKSYWDPEHGWTDIMAAWSEDEFVLDATRITLSVAGSGWDGDTFKNEILMNKHGIQINKTSRNTVLFMTNIGTSRSSVAYLIEALVAIARDLERKFDEMSPWEFDAYRRAVTRLTTASAPLPNFGGFHEAFRSYSDPQTPEGDMRKAFFGTYVDGSCEYVLQADVEKRVAAGEKLVSATFVTPYPPGFPVLVPGQVITEDVLEFMARLDTPEVHGYEAEVGYRVYRPSALPGAQAPAESTSVSAPAATNGDAGRASDAHGAGAAPAAAPKPARPGRARAGAGAKAGNDGK